MQRVLLDFSNIRVGGGLVVASATLADAARPEVQRRYPWLEHAHFWVSQMVRRNLSVPENKLPGLITFKDTAPTVRALLRRPKREFEVRFTLFGPTYTGRLARREITGFADMTMLVSPREIGLAAEPTRLRPLVQSVVKRHLIMRSDLYVTETALMADRLAERFGISRANIHVVPNRPHPLFAAHAIVAPRPAGSAPGELHVACPARAYPHKNLAVVEPSGDLFQQQTGKRLVVHTTLRDQEWAAMPAGARRWMLNHGELTTQQVLNVYRKVDAIFFPSLLETSSVTPLEANVLGIPLLASNRDFVRSSAHAALLFEPRDPASVAAALVDFEADKGTFWERARTTAVDYREHLSRSSRSEAYFDLIDGQLGAEHATT